MTTKKKTTVTKRAKKPVEKVEQVEAVEPAVEQVEQVEPVEPEPVVEPVPVPTNESARIADTEKMLANLRLASARAELDNARAAQNPDAMLSAMDKIAKLQEELK